MVAIDQEHADAVSAFGQNARHDETIAAVVPGPGNDGDAQARRMARGDPVRDRSAGILHQFDAWNAARNRQAVGLRHLSCREQFNHRSESIALSQSARPRVRL